MHLKITPQRTAGPLSRQCQRCRRQSAAVRAVFPLYFHLREQLADTLYHKGRQQFRPRLIAGAPGHGQCLRWLGQGGIDILQLIAQRVERGVGQQYPLLLQKLTLLFVQ